jgi:preprotein translocase subunit SecF
MALIYFDLRTVDLCSEWEAKNYTLSFDVSRVGLLGRGVVTVILYLWVPLFLIVLFGWTEFTRHYSSTILVGQLAGLFNTLFLSFLLLYMVLITPVQSKVTRTFHHF